MTNLITAAKETTDHEALKHLLLCSQNGGSVAITGSYSLILLGNMTEFVFDFCLRKMRYHC